jgi:hypothetical protein
MGTQLADSLIGLLFQTDLHQALPPSPAIWATDDRRNVYPVETSLPLGIYHKLIDTDHRVSEYGSFCSQMQDLTPLVPSFT